MVIDLRYKGPLSDEIPPYRVFASVVILASGDDPELPSFLRSIDTFLGARFDRHELVVVDNCGGTDPAVLSPLQSELRGTLVHMVLSRRHDTERAMLAGLSRAMGDFVFEVSLAETDWPLDLLVSLFETCANGIDVVDASSHEPSWARRRFFRSLNRFSYLDIPDDPVSVRVVSRRALNATLDMREKVRYRRALYAATGFPHATVRYEGVGDRRGKRDTAWFQQVGKGFDVMISFSEFGLRLANLAALVFATVAAIALVYTLAVFVLQRDVVAGWTTLMLLASFGFAGLFVVLSLMGEYLARILIEVRQRPPYHLQSVTVYPSHLDRPQPESTPLLDREVTASEGSSATRPR